MTASFRFSKTRHNWPFLAFLPNFCPLKMSHLSIFEFWHFSPIFVLLKMTCLVTLFDRKLQVFKNSPMDHFGHFSSTFVHSKWKRSSLRSQCWMRLSLWFSNTVFPQKNCKICKKIFFQYFNIFVGSRNDETGKKPNTYPWKNAKKGFNLFDNCPIILGFYV